jgi:hypothetical protein
LKRTQHSIVYTTQYISLIGLRLKRIQHSIVYLSLTLCNQIQTQFSLDFSVSFQVLFSFSTFLILYVEARWESNDETYKSMSFVKESCFYNYAATTKQLCKHLIIPYVIKFILINWVKQNCFICFGCEKVCCKMLEISFILFYFIFYDSFLC